MGQDSSGRRDAIDVARVVALLIVVVGHLTLAIVDRHDGSVRGANLLALRPGWAWVAAGAPMPVFFAAAGWANAEATVASATRRLRTLVGAAAVVVVCWSALVVAVSVAGEAGVVADGARIATQPVWFLAAYIPFASAGRILARAAARSPLVTIGGCLTTVAALDAARFGLSAPEWIGWPSFFLAWAVPWLAGGWWRDRAATQRFHECRVGVALAVSATAAAVALVHVAGYSPALIDAVEGTRSNTTPPSLYTAVAALAQVGVLLTVARWLDRAGRRWRRLWDRAGEAAVGVYLWHLSALALCAGVVALGLPVPERLTVDWWFTRPLWWTAVIGIALGLVATTAAARAKLRRQAVETSEPGRPPAMLGIVLATAGAGLVGLRGPRTAPMALVCSALFVGAWLVLGPSRATPMRRYLPLSAVARTRRREP